MKRSNLFMTLASVLVIASIALAACGGGATTVAPQPTKAPAPTSVPPTTAPQPTKAPEATATPAGCAAPAGTSPIQPPASGAKTVTGGWTQEPNNIAPYYTNMSYAVWIAQLTLVGLGEWDDKGNFVPELAADVPTADNGGVSADGKTITWHLKDCLYWSDGERITSKDVKYTWESVVDPKNAVNARTGYDKIDSIDTPDELTVVIKFKELFPPWQTLFTQGPNNTGSILPAHLLEGKTGLENDPFIHQPSISSGPFVITEWVAGDHMTLLPNANFYKGRAKLDQVNIKFIPDPETALAALKTGDLDWYPDFSESDISTVGALEPDIHLLVVPGADFEHYFFNTGTTAGVDGKGISDLDGFCPFQDVRVRKAIVLGIDRQTVVDTLLEGKTIVPASQWPNSSWTNTDLKAEAYDPDAAMKLLDEAGYKPGADGIRHGPCNGKDTKLSFNFETTTKQLRVDIALAAQADLKKIGVEFKPIHTPAGTFFATYTEGGILGTGKYDMAGYTTGFYPDPWTDNWLCDSVPNKAKPDGVNNYHYCNPELDKLFEEANATADPAARKVALDAAQKFIYDNSLVVMMYARANVYGYVDRFVPAAFGFLSNMNWNAEEWDVK
jgi:peptide/nickel transport system substrate-binding protein